MNFSTTVNIRYSGKITNVKNSPCLLLIHGFPTASWDWQKLWQPLGESFRLLTLDMIGFGLSDKPKSFNYCFPEQANIVEHLIQKLGIGDYHLLAHDYGDTVAQELMARQIESKRSAIKSVCLLNGGLFPEATRPVMMQKLLCSPFGTFIAKLITYKKFSASLRRICTKPLSDDELQTFWRLIQYNNGVSVMPRIIQYMKERKANRSRWVNALQKFAPPLRLINGIDDPISGLNTVNRYEELLSNADVVRLKGVGHYPQVESPGAVLNAYLDFASLSDLVK